MNLVDTPEDTARLLADLDVGSRPRIVQDVVLGDLPLPGERTRTPRRTEPAGLRAKLDEVLAHTAEPMAAGEIAEVLGMPARSLSRRLAASFVEVGKGRWWSPDRALPGPDPAKGGVTLPGNVGERVRAEAALGRSEGFVRRRR